jgi:hypothetical protein
MAMQETMQEIKNMMLDRLRDVHTILPGKVVTFDPDKCEASILPYGKYKKPDGSMIDFPQLNEVPVYVMQGSEQTATVVYPVKPDDECLVLFTEQTLETWRTKAESHTDLRFDLSNATAIIGMFSKPNPLIKEACDDDSLIIEKDGERVRLKKGETYIRDTAGQSITLTPTVTTLVVNNLIVQSAGDILMTAAGAVNVNATGAMVLNGSTVNIN